MQPTTPDEHWDDPDFAAAWDRTVYAGNPTRAEQVDILLAILQATARPGDTVLDLGIGTGLVEADLLARVPHLTVIGVDSSPAMLELARRRLLAFADRVTLIERDLRHLGGLDLPPLAAAFSVQSLHHLSHDAQRAALAFAADRLRPGGHLLQLDRMAVDAAGPLRPAYAAMWDRLEARAAVRSGWTADQLLARLEDRDDHPARPDEVVAWMRGAGLEAADCIRQTCRHPWLRHLHLNRALCVGVRPEP